MDDNIVCRSHHEAYIGAISRRLDRAAAERKDGTLSSFDARQPSEPLKASTVAFTRTETEA